MASSLGHKHFMALCRCQGNDLMDLFSEYIIAAFLVQRAYPVYTVNMCSYTVNMWHL
jgi:hypothetical protein